jgi:hypothetical protein
MAQGIVWREGATGGSQCMKIRALFGNLVLAQVLLVGVYLMYQGVYRGTKFWPLLTQKPERLIISEVLNRNGRRILPDYVAIGNLEGDLSKASVPLFQDQFDKLSPGARMDVYRLESKSHTEWVSVATLEESKPMFNALGLHFSWHLFAGSAITAYMVWLLRPVRQRKAGNATI